MSTRTLLNLGRSGLAALALLAIVAGPAAAAPPDGWRLEEGVSAPSYAVAEPTSSNLNIDVVALVCEEAGTERGLQLQLYLSGQGPLLPNGASPQRLKDTARAEIVLDGQVFPTAILFTDDRVILADSQRQRAPVLSERLVEAMQAGKTMLLRFDLVNGDLVNGQPAAFDGEAAIDLRAGAGSRAIAAVRRCADPAGDHVAGVSVTSP